MTHSNGPRTLQEPMLVGRSLFIPKDSAPPESLDGLMQTFFIPISFDLLQVGRAELGMQRVAGSGRQDPRGVEGTAGDRSAQRGG
jgi:hypothetical protein